MKPIRIHPFFLRSVPAAWLAIVGALVVMPALRGQGCVQSRGAGIGMLMEGADNYLPAGGWQAGVAYRWLHSDRHFVGGKEQPRRQAEGSEVINDSHFIDVSLTYSLTKRVSFNLTLPFVYSDRSSLYEHDRTNRFSMVASGLGDLRLGTAVWLFDPATCHDGNIALGVGLKAPTGDSEATDIKHRPPPTGPVLDYVDQSIQPGDGGWGAFVQLQGFQRLVKDLYGYADASYLINPEEKNSATGYSIPDTYLLRAGLSYPIWPSQGVSLSLGGRMEGVPVTDWIGSSEGSRRPGYSLSIEPGIFWVRNKWAVAVTAPVAIDRNRERSVQDIARGRHGDAAFADFVITSSISYRF